MVSVDHGEDVGMHVRDNNVSVPIEADLMADVVNLVELAMVRVLIRFCLGQHTPYDPSPPAWLREVDVCGSLVTQALDGRFLSPLRRSAAQ